MLVAGLLLWVLILTFGGHLHDGHDRTGKHGAIAAAFADIDPPIIIFVNQKKGADVLAKGQGF